ncbi:MAG: anti-sigma-factor antagonist [Bacteroidota bacterium]|jgi:anti-sigma B factor antagonist|nr:anti-sigma-factor antagonist [Bacteroidota bacterium]
MIFDFKSKSEKGIHIYELMGELIDKDQSTALMAEIDAAVAKGENKILLDLASLKYINSSGLNIFINILTKARKASGDVAICCVNKKINELLVITKLNSVFNVSSSTEEAMAILNK